MSIRVRLLSSLGGLFAVLLQITVAGAEFAAAADTEATRDAGACADRVLDEARAPGQESARLSREVGPFIGRLRGT